MPTYFARGVTVRLGAQALADTITPKIALRKGDLAKTQCEEAERKLLGSELLDEERVDFLGDEAGYGLTWLGGAPFMQVRTGESLFDEDTSSCPPTPAGTVNPADLRRRSIINGDCTPRVRTRDDSLALSLHVKLSEKTFISGLDTSNKLHLKIEVFFNGNLSSCLFVPDHDIRSGAKKYHQVFAGYRIDYLAERPWVILAPQKTAEHASDAADILPVEKRWDEICRALGREAEERGMDKNGNISPTAEFLKALAIMQMPTEVQAMQESGTKTFGVIDVVITAGDGRKVTSGTGYLKGPQRLTDESYPERVVRDNAAIELHDSPQHEAEIPESREVPRLAKKTVDASVDGESDSDFEPPPKRRARAPRVLEMHPKLKAAPSPLALKEAGGLQLTSTSIVKTPKPTSSMPSFSGQGKRVDETSSSPERGRNHQQQSTSQEEHHAFSGATVGDSPSVYSFPTSSMSHARTSQMQMQPSPYRFQSSNSLLGLESPSSFMGLKSFGNTGYMSSPLPQVARDMDLASPPDPGPPIMRMSELSRDNQGRAMDTAMANYAEMSRRGSVSSIPSNRYDANAPWNQHVPLQGTRPPANLNGAGHVPNMLPMSTSFDLYGHQSLGGLPLFSTSLDRRFSLPLPPTGMFSVPTKPRFSRSPSKSSRSVSPKKSDPYFPVNRLVITGKNGATIVDHRWPTAQLVARHGGALTSESLKASPLRSLSSSMGSAAAHEQPETRRSSRSEILVGPSPTLLPGRKTPSSVSFSRGKQLVDVTKMAPMNHSPDSSDLSSPMSFVEDAKDEIMRTADKVVANLPRNAKTATRAAARSATPQRRISSNNNILGVQGPKATTFWLEDPEEVLREAARLRRAKSPLKRKRTPAPAVEHTTSVPVSSALNLCETGSSSPLSTAPSSPEPENRADVKLDDVMPKAMSASAGADAISQLDGSPERRPTRSSPSKLTRSPAKPLTPSPTKKLSPTKKTPKTPKSSPRKPAGRFLPREPRSPDRLKTVGNPPLNQDCVIAFAESGEKEESVVRQVRGERQGVFKEEYVVCAMRFYVPGG